MRKSLLVAITVLCWLVPAAGASAASDDRFVVVGPVLVDRAQTANDIAVVDGDVTIRGRVSGSIFVVDGDVTIRGTVDGDVVAIAGLVTLGRRGSVGGDIDYGDKRPVLVPGAKVGGKVEKFDVGDAGILGAIGAFIAITISMFLLGLVLLLLAPRAADAVARTGRAKGLVCAGVGLLGIILIPAIAIVAFITLVGIPLGVVLLLLFAALLAISYVTAAFVLGRLVLKKGARILAFLVGLVILGLLTLIPIAGAIIGFLAIIFGLGVLLVSLFRARG
jgi:hypothetical protein